MYASLEDEDSTRGSPDVQGSSCSTLRAAPLSLSMQDRSIVRSCLTCHQRKVRCDKRSPCSNCVRTDVLCCYPEVEPSRRRPQRTTIGEISVRLARLERTISAITSGDLDIKTASNSPNLHTETGMDEDLAASSPEEILVQDGDTSRYINEVILSRVLDEERELKAAMSSPSFNTLRGIQSAPSDLGGIFHDFNLCMDDVQSYHPSKWQALRLWQTFVNNVDPVLKVLHIPTAQATIHSAINNPSNTEHNLNALLFSIYFAATTSLSTADTSYLLGQDRNIYLAKFKKALEHSLAGANIFDSPTLRSLQAITIYITCLRTFNTGRSSWALTGLAIRLAQSIGLHRDGSNLGLTPFESEMRRRVWWYLFVADSRTAEDIGITVCNIDQSFGPRLPLNVNDSELSPGMRELPEPSSDWTEMTFALIKIDLNRITRLSIEKPAVAPGGTLSESSKIQILKDTRARLEDKYLKYSDLNIPIHRASSLVTRIILAKLECVTQQQSTQPRAEKISSDANEEALLSTCRTLETYLQLQTDELLRGFQWYLGSYTQYHLLTYILRRLCVKPDGPNVERAWNALECSFQQAENRQLSAETESKWTFLRLLRGKALRIRDAYNSGNLENNSASLADKAGMVYSTNELGEATDIRLGDTWSWGMANYADFQDWGNIVEGRDMHDFNDL